MWCLTLVGDLDGLGVLAGLDVTVERREEVLHGDWLRGGGRRGLRFGRHREVVRSGEEMADNTRAEAARKKPRFTLGCFFFANPSLLFRF